MRGHLRTEGYTRLGRCSPVVLFRWLRRLDCVVGGAVVAVVDGVDMSRRKQARPRSLKRDDLEPFAYDDESSQDTLPLVDSNSCFNCDSPSGAFETSSILSDDHASLDEEDSTHQQTCGNCGLRFSDIDEFLEHLNQDCMAGGSSGGGGSSQRSSDTPDDLSLSPGSCGPSSGDPDAELSYTVGVTENTPYGCQFCDKAFPRLSYLKRHEQIHSDQMPFRCDYCQRLFKHKRSRDRHVKLHTGDRKYRCSQCESAFSRSDHLKIHMKTHDNGKPYQCTVCNRGYNTAAALSSHMQNHKKSSEQASGDQVNSQANSSSGSTGAPTEAQVDKSSTERDLNESPNTPKPTLCSLCPQVCSSPNALAEHVLQNHQNFSSPSPLSQSPRPPSKCYRCADELSSPNAICTHKKTPNDTDSEKLASEGQKSMDRFSPSLKLTCGFCCKSDFPSFESLQLHVQVLHLPTGSESSMASIRSLQSLLHKRPLQPSAQTDNMGIYDFDCNPTFAALQTLQKHMAIGDSLMMKRPGDIYCSQCNISFGSSSSLLEHVQMVHETSNPSQTSPISPQSNKRSLASSRLRPNGTKHLKSANALNSQFMVFNGNASSHYRRQDPGGGLTNMTVPNASSGQSPSPSNNATTLLCSQCSAGFPDFESFRTHLKSHLEAAAASTSGGRTTPALQRFACPECNAEFSSDVLLDNHVMGHFLAATTEYGCQSCMKLFSKPDELQKHLMDIHAHHLYRCALCKQIFDSKVSIQVHFAVKHSNECRSLKCTSCSAYFRTDVEFQVHVKLSHLSTTPNKSFQSFRCLFCDQLFPNEVQLRIHTSTHKKQFSCSACGEAFHVEFLLDRHIQTVHQGAGNSSPSLSHPFLEMARQQQQGCVSSQVASSESGVSSAVDLAQNLSTKKKQNGAQMRGEQHPSPNASIVTPPPQTTSPTTPTPTTHRCDICDLVCMSESGLSAHRRQAHHLRSHSKDHKSSSPSVGAAVSLFCAYCSESCKSRNELENHMKAHTATPSKHKCNICDEMCPSATTLAEHKLTHCKVVSGSTCIVCRVQLQSEDQFLSHIQQHNATSPPSSGNQHPLPVPCVVCRQTLVVDVEVRMHARFHLKNALFEPLTGAPCCVCSRVFDLGNLIIRATGKPSDSVVPHTYMCKDCFHSKGEDAGGSLRCLECGVKFETHGDLDVHKKTVHQREDKKTYQCIKCQMSFESEADIQTHVTCHVMHEGTNHECRLCHEVLDSPSKLQCHLIEHTFEGCSHYTCYLCASVFTGSHLLQRHMLEHGLDSRPYDCTECRQRFFFRAELENHAFLHTSSHRSRSTPNSILKVNSELRFYECQQCPRVFGSSSDLQKHQRSHLHSEGTFKQEFEKDLITCTKCGLDFSCVEDMRNHVNLVHPMGDIRDSYLHDKGHFNAILQDDYHSEINQIADELKMKAREKNLRGNERSEKKYFECPECNKRFTRKENRKLHMKTHHQQVDVKTFPCTHCEKSFSKRSHYKEHVLTHTNTKRHSCQMCDETFPSIDLLEKHEKSAHNQENENTCIVCAMSFESGILLDEHLASEHQVQTLTSDGSETLTEGSPNSPQSNACDSPKPDSKEDTLMILSSETLQDNESTAELETVESPRDFSAPEERTNLPAEVAA